MRIPFRYSRGVAGGVVCILLLICYSSLPTGYSSKNLIQQLHDPDGKVKYLFFIVPGGPVFEESAPMRKLVEQGNPVQSSLLPELKDARVRNEVALILGQIGDKNAVPHLIEFLPTDEKLTKEEDFSTLCLLHALGQLTGKSTGIGRFGMNYTPDVRKEWQVWYGSHKDYLYSPSHPKPASWGLAMVLVDVEAKLATQPTSDYRKAHPWISYDEINIWRDDAAYERKLNDFCFSVILNSSSRETVRSLGRIRDRRALSALHMLCTYVEDVETCYDLIWTLEERGDPSSIPILERIPRSKKAVSDSNEPRRLRAIDRIRLLQRFGKDLKDKPFDAEDQTIFMECLDNAKGVKDLVANLRNRDNDWCIQRYLRVASFVDRDSVRSCLKQMASDKSRDDRARTMAHGALARLGEKDSLDHLTQSLTHKDPGVRLAAAESLWRLGSHDGLKTLVDLLDLRPVETGGEGVTTGNGAIITVTAIRNSNLDIIRSACKTLGEMGDKSAVEPLKRLLPINLNGILATGGSGTGWSGRPDVVALARLGDFSGIAVLRESIKRGDPLGAAGSWGTTGDFVEIGLKRFIPEIFPLLEDRDESKRVQAAQTILLLLENGR